MAAYYNEIDPYAAQWLRNLIEAGHIAPGVVDERSIEDVHPSDLLGFTQCHFFAGLGGWSIALRRAGWADDRPIWTGSCPCQPFSATGAGAGFEDPRHLWPSFSWLIKERKPPVVAGEQVASKIVEPWVDLVHADMEAMGYAFGAIAFPSAGVGAPHIRDRVYWLGHTDHQGSQGHSGNGGSEGWSRSQRPATKTGVPVRMANALGEREEPAGNKEGAGEFGGGGEAERLADADGGLQSGGERCGSLKVSPAKRPQGSEKAAGHSGDSGPGPVNGRWADSDWLFCRDGKWRPVEPGTSPLAHGISGRVGRLRAYGNAINVEAATQFIAAYLET
ncbi:DNA cytosine methyltransferase [Pseudomonas sp. TMB3-21]